MVNLLKLLYSERKRSFLRLFVVFFIVSITLALSYEIYHYGNTEASEIAKKTKISMVFKFSTSETEINGFINELHKDSQLESIEYISPSQAEKEFFATYQSFSSDLLTVNPFPPIVNVTFKRSYFKTEFIEKFIIKYSGTNGIDQIRYKKDFVDAYTLFYNHVVDYIISFSVLISLIFIIVLFFTVKTDYEYYSVEMNRRLLLEKDDPAFISRSSIILSINIFIFINIFICLIFTDFLFTAIWWFLRSSVLWLELVNLKSVYICSVVTGVSTLIISFVSSFFISRKTDG